MIGRTILRVKPKPTPYRVEVKKRVIRAVGPFGSKPKPPTRNDRRRQRYATDLDYQETLRARARATYRAGTQMELANCLRSLDFYRTLAIPRRVTLPNGEERVIRVMRLASVAHCLQKIYQTVWRWKRDGMIPEPVLVLTGRGTKVYHIDEVRILIEEIGAHERVMAYYRADHQEVKHKIFTRINNLRNPWR